MQEILIQNSELIMQLEKTEQLLKIAQKMCARRRSVARGCPSPPTRGTRTRPAPRHARCARPAARTLWPPTARAPSARRRSDTLRAELDARQSRETDERTALQKQLATRTQELAETKAAQLHVADQVRP